MAKIVKENSKSKDNTLKKIKKRNRRYITVLKWMKPKDSILNFNDLPSGVIIDIFSYISLEDLFKNVRLVCTQWYALANSAGLWKTIKAGPDVPSESLLKWLENAPKLKSLNVQNRIDAGQILKRLRLTEPKGHFIREIFEYLSNKSDAVQKYNKKIENINIQDCWGCDRRINLPSTPLCNVLVRCPYLDSICLKGSRFISCKFFRLLASRDLILAKRKRNIDHEKRSRKIHYYGSAIKKQLLTFLKSRIKINRNKLALLTQKTNPVDGSKETVRQEIIVKSEEDILKILDILRFQ